MDILLQARIKRWLFGIALVGVLGITFMAYLQPSFMVDLANRIIMCF